ncbi:MAG TPA: ABC transporter ATP-binding protein [Clostridiales bacterium]|nr:ABC transporter ATP-binding protein [Clostridiales bacterium]
MLKMEHVDVFLDSDNGKRQVLKDINLTLEQKKIYVMTGPNGGGKSTIAKVIMGMVIPSGGKISLDHTDITGMNITERARAGIGYAFQTPPRFKGLTVRDMLELSARGNEIDPCSIMYDVGLCAQDYLDRDINTTFSGGELKRVEIAGLLARQLKVAIFDEPEAGIDLWSFQRLIETFDRMNRKSDAIMIIISHQERILRLADQVILVKDGEIAEITGQEKILEEISLLDSRCECKKNCIKGGNENVDCDR